jgi:glycosyltransferase involved in cell wall biosynthesis
VPPDNARALADALLSLMDDPSRAAAVGAAARRKVEDRFSFERMVNAFEQLYFNELFARAPRRAAAAQLQPS